MPVAVGPDLLVTLDRSSGATLHEQLELGLRESVRSGRLAPGSRLPSSRALAAELGISRGVVLEAYAQLTAEGYLTSSQGAPTRVASTTSIERPPVPAGSLSESHELDFAPAMPDLAAFPRDDWMRSYRAAMRTASFRSLGGGDPRGSPELRNELMNYLGRGRGAAPEPEHTVLCAGFTQGFAVLCRSLADRGVERIALEDPGWPQHRLIAERAGLEPVPVAVDELGIDVVALTATGCEVVVVTPAHQFPTGAVLASDRRGGLLEWAEEIDGLIVEDDYDSELRYDRVAVGALQGLAPERVCHIGSASKRLAPGVGLGWMLSPSWLTGALTFEKGLADGGSPTLDQLALADFIARGELERHLRRVRLRYRERRDALIAALSRSLPCARVHGVAAGLFVLAVLPDAVDEEALVSAAAARGVGVEALSWHRIGGGGPPGLVLGFANLAQAAIERGVAELGRALESAV
ncbi:MAG: MocR-like pyridoxine biosynthesis transcription factor PdxR [Solirubrobacteraceae bacterium]